MLTALAGGCCMLHGGVAQAAETTNVTLEIAGCDGARLPAGRLVELLRTEVAPARLVLAGEARASVPERPGVRGAIELCHGAPDLVRVALSVGSETSLERVVDLSDVAGELRVRTLAVAFAEMLVRLPAVTETKVTEATGTTEQPPRTDHENPARLASGAERAVAPAPAASVARSRDSRWRAGAGVGLRSYADPQTTFVGPWLSLEIGPWHTEALFSIAREPVPNGSVSLHDMAAALGWAPLKFGSAVEIALGVRAELGMTRASGVPGDDSEARGATRWRARAALLAEPRIGLAFTSALAAEARFWAGIAHGATATVDGAPVATAGGPFVGTAVGLNVGF